jgi:hypothetical protein
LVQDGSMKRVALLMAVLLSFPAFFIPFEAQALNKKLGPKSYMDARHCLELPTRTEIIKCAEKYM